MIENRKVICILCPAGCVINIKLKKGKIVSVSGNRCIRGADYARKECINPVRILTTTVRVSGNGLLSVKSQKPLPKSIIFDCMKELNNIRISIPVKSGDIIIKNILNTGIDIIATSEIKE